MAYFKGGDGGYYWLGEYKPFVPISHICCDACAETYVPLKPKGTIGRHWDSGYKWAPWYGGKATCAHCGKEC
jgi:hypothetical protein